MKKDKIEYALLISGTVLLLAFLIMQYFFPSISFVGEIICIVFFAALSFFYFKETEHKFLGSLFGGYAILVLLKILKVLSNKLFVILFLSWTGLLGLIYVIFFGVIAYILINRLRWNDPYHKKIKEEAKKAREEKAKKEQSEE